MNIKIIPLLFAASALTFGQGQGPRGPQMGNSPMNGSGLDMTKIQTIEGSVAVINIAYGARYPSIQINQTTIKIAPVWFLLESDFEIKAGDKLKVTAAPSLQAQDAYLSAISLTNTASNVTLKLRDSNGLPLWSQGGHGMGAGHGTSNPQGPETCGACGLTNITTATGVVDQVTAGIGIQMPTLVLKASDGKVLTVKIGPERILESADFEIKAGDKLTVKYGTSCIGEFVAVSLTNAAGVTVVLRDEDGTPAWR